SQLGNGFSRAHTAAQLTQIAHFAIREGPRTDSVPRRLYVGRTVKAASRRPIRSSRADVPLPILARTISIAD
ncbi:MAG: hypothetical protein KAY37_15805, partial [Phycisphaerae bacterium]|nr:hypothetical protein [Phycisphaerae bacterium]